MFEKCGFINWRSCPMCTESKGEYYCGQAKNPNIIRLMKVCPLRKNKKYDALFVMVEREKKNAT